MRNSQRALSAAAKEWKGFSLPLICCKLRQESQAKLAAADQNAVKRRRALQTEDARDIEECESKKH
jgi:hypothetical protein